MKAIRRPDQYLSLRGCMWRCVRRMPKAVNDIDDRTLIYRSLESDNLKRLLGQIRKNMLSDKIEKSEN